MVPPQYQQRRPTPAARPMAKHGIPWLTIIAVIVALIIVYFVATWVLGSLSSVNITGPTTLNVTAKTSLFYLGGSQYTINFVSSSSPTAVVSVTRLPYFINPTMYVTLYLDNDTNVNGAGTYANMQLRLLATGKSGASVAISPLPLSYAISPSSSRITLVVPSLQLSNSSQQTTTSTTTTGSSTSSSSTTAGPTTTITQYSQQYNNALNVTKESEYYPAMVNYTNLYASVKNCTASLYNTTFINRFGHLANTTAVTDTYENISALLPYQMTFALTNSSATAWTATYATVAKTSTFTTTALVININSYSKVITSQQLTATGIFSGENVTQLKNGYVSASGIGNACGIWITGTQCYTLKAEGKSC